MKIKVFSLALIVILLLTATMGCASTTGTSDKTLNIFTWADYFPKHVLDQFTEKTGITINFTPFSTNEEMLAKLEAVKGGTYDIVLASDYIIDIARNANLLAEIDKSKVTNFKNINPSYQGQFFDPDSKYTVPYAAGTPLIIYDPAKVPFEIKGYNDFWNPALTNSIVLMDDMRNLMGITLKSLGYSFNTKDTGELEKAREKLLTLKPNIRALDYDTPHNLMINGEATVGYMFTPQVVTALNERPDLKVVYPEEGMGWGIDSVFVPVDAPNKDAAWQFLNFILQPEIAADISENELYICCNQAATQFLSKEYLDNKALYIPAEILGDAEYIMDVGDATAKFDEIWTEFKQQ